MEYAPNSPGCRINLFGGDVQPAVDTKSLLFFKLCKHTILRNTSLLSPYKKKKTWLRDVEGMNAWGPTFFYFGSEKSMVFDNWGMGLPTWPVDDLPSGDCHSFVDLYGCLCYPLTSGND